FTNLAAGGSAISGTPIAADPQLGRLQNNRGPTPTMAPASSSPARDAGAAGLASVDQRGQPRDARPDLGAYEVVTGTSVVATGDVHDLIGAVTAANATDEPDVLEVSGDYVFAAADNYWYGPDALPAISSAITIAGDPASGAVLERSQAAGTPA